jgi:alpha-tubulin suppressor-like RCC1 family protein
VLAEVSNGNKVYCVGWGDGGVLGSGLPNDGSKQPVAIKGLKTTSRIRQLVGNSNDTFVCASYAGSGDFDTVQCWGGYDYGYTPLDIAGTSGTVSLATGGTHTCALLSDQTVTCWDAGNLVAVPVAGIVNATRIVVGNGFACAITRSIGSPGSLWCWGVDDYGGVVSNKSTPWRVEAPAGNLLDVAAGSGHVCAVVETTAGTGDVYCWGDNQYAQLGQGFASSSKPIAGAVLLVRVKGISKVKAVFAAEQSTCALTSSQRVLCWGYNSDSQLGAGTDMSPVTLPVVMKKLCA